jgi:ubiquinone/menaquinone biosynthesis C-methylase UbiE
MLVCCENSGKATKIQQNDLMCFWGHPMTISKQQSQEFKEFERVGWGKQADHYDSLVGEMTRQAVDSLIAAVDAQPNSKLLDVATGPGYVAAEAARRGLDATGVDIAKDMVSEARRRFPQTKFEIADAENLRYEDATFDAVTCAFGMLHFPRPGKAIAEAYCVLCPADALPPPSGAELQKPKLSH